MPNDNNDNNTSNIVSIHGEPIEQVDSILSAEEADPLEVLQEFTAAIEADRNSVSRFIIFYTTPVDEGGEVVCHRAAGCSRADALAMVLAAQRELVGAWFG